MFKFFKALFSKSKVVDTLPTWPQLLKNGTTLEEAKLLITKASLPVKQQVAETPMVRVLQERVMTQPNGKKLRYFQSVLRPNNAVCKKTVL